jgi:hypothetical protein
VSASPPTALSAVFRRITNEVPALTVAPEAPLLDDTGPELYGFEEPVLHAPEHPPEPAPEDILALLGEQPEVAPFVDVHTASAAAAVTVARLEPRPNFAPAPVADEVLAARHEASEPPPQIDVHIAEIGKAIATGSSELEPELVPELPLEFEADVPPPFDSLPPEPSPSPRQALIARFNSRFVTRPAIPAAARAAPEAEPEIESQPEPVPSIPPMPPPRNSFEPPPQPSIEAPPQLPPELPSQPAAPPLSFSSTDRATRQSHSRNRRLYRRVQLGAEIEINGSASSLIDVSIGGFAATGVADLGANTIVPVSLRLTIDGIEVGTQVHARIVYANRERVSGRFIDLTASQTAFLRYIVTWRGESVGTVGTTTLLDSITGGPLHGFPPKDAQESRERWWHGMIGRKIQPPR